MGVIEVLEISLIVVLDRYVPLDGRFDRHPEALTNDCNYSHLLCMHKLLLFQANFTV
jgi:hypothetical protein